MSQQLSLENEIMKNIEKNYPLFFNLLCKLGLERKKLYFTNPYFNSSILVLDPKFNYFSNFILHVEGNDFKGYSKKVQEYEVCYLELIVKNVKEDELKKVIQKIVDILKEIRARYIISIYGVERNKVTYQTKNTVYVKNSLTILRTTSNDPFLDNSYKSLKGFNRFKIEIRWHRNIKI